MKTELLPAGSEAAPIVRCRSCRRRSARCRRRRAGAEADALQRARAFAEPLLAGQVLDTGEDALAHADGVAGDPARRIGAAPSMRAAAYLVYAGDYLQQARGGGRARPSARRTPSLVDAHAQAGADAARGARGAGRRTSSARSRPSACARCCWRSRATCAWCCCGWRRACRRCAGIAAAQAAVPGRAGARVACRCSRRWPTGWASGRSSGRSRTCRSAFSQPDDYTARRAPARREARRARSSGVEASRARLRDELAARTASTAAGAGPAQAHLQHLEEDAGQGRSTSRRCSTCARCA